MPYNRKPELGRDELEGFENYVRKEYQHDLREAYEIVRTEIFPSNTMFLGMMSAVFDKLAAPRVFLIEKWRNLSDSERLGFYSKDYQDRAKAEAEAISKKASEALS